MVPKYIDVRELMSGDTIVYMCRNVDDAHYNKLMLVKISNIEEYEDEDISGIRFSGEHTALSEDGPRLLPNGFWLAIPRNVLLIDREDHSS